MRWESQIVDHEERPFQREKTLLLSKLYWTAPPPSQRPGGA
ncbi:unnamed protein product [Spirodela intermedia]|uniref:Uncharacterized protein n=1 Tax=Spirodela intermedia TaxID=51605 RepID=A0A7I8LNM1_SPIIN|nr:unnamed protein product [Spirodela intermedia]